MVSIIPSNRASEAQTFRNHHHLASSHRTQWKYLVFIRERISCTRVSGNFSLMLSIAHDGQRALDKFDELVRLRLDELMTKMS